MCVSAMCCVVLWIYFYSSKRNTCTYTHTHARTSLCVKVPLNFLEILNLWLTKPFLLITNQTNDTSAISILLILLNDCSNLFINREQRRKQHIKKKQRKRRNHTLKRMEVMYRNIVIFFLVCDEHAVSC